MKVETGAQLRVMRKAKGMTLKQVAEHLGRTEAFMSMVENAKTNISQPDLIKLSGLYGTSPDEILKFELEGD